MKEFKTFQPVIKWTGSKRSQAKDIIKFFPDKINIYMEPFLGGGSIMRSLMESGIPVKRYLCSDINPDLIWLWRDIRDIPGKLIEDYSRMWHEMNDKDDDKNRKKDYYNSVRMRFNRDRDTSDFLFLLRTCVNGMPRYNSIDEFNTSFHITRNGVLPGTLAKIILEWHELLKMNDVIFSHCSYSDVTSRPGDFLYLDPPYANTKGIYYGRIDYPRFFSWIASQQGSWALSFDGKAGDKDFTFAVPESLYKEHVFIPSGNSSFRRVTGISKDTEVFESLYLNR